MPMPQSKETFTRITDGETPMEGVDLNGMMTEIENISTMLGGLGVAQSNTDSLKNLLSNYRQGVNVEYKSETELTVKAGEIVIPDASGNLRWRKNTEDITVTWSMIDAGAEAAGTKYYIWAIADAGGTNFTILISTSATAPTGSTFKRLIGSFYNNASSDITEVVNLGRENRIGDTIIRTENTPYQAETDGWFIGTIAATNASSGNIIGYSDSSEDPTTQLGYAAAMVMSGHESNTTSNFGSFCIPVKKGNYYKGNINLNYTSGGALTRAYYWIPFS